MSYAPVTDQSSPVPPPALNGGLYTGRPFRQGAPWANAPVRPTLAAMTQTTLRSADAPTLALYQMPAMTRPGNNTDDAFQGVDRERFNRIGLPCIACVERPDEDVSFTTVSPFIKTCP